MDKETNSKTNDDKASIIKLIPMDTVETPSTTTITTTAESLEPSVEKTSNTASTSTSKTLKRFLSVPIIHTTQQNKISAAGNNVRPTTMVTRAAAAARNVESSHLQDTPKKYQHPNSDSSTISCIDYFSKNIHIRSNPSSREVSPTPMFNIFAPRARRYSASYSPLGTNATVNTNSGAPLCLTSRVSQLKHEECIDMNSREVNHERQVHSAMQISQSWEDLTLVAENWSCKSDEFSNPLQVTLPTTTTTTSCSSPSPSNNRAGLRLPYSPSPTRRTFATRRSMSPIAMRPSQLAPVKRKFELDDNNASNWNVYSPPPVKKAFIDSGSSSVCPSPSSFCPSPDSGIYDGRNTPKLFISKLCTTNSTNSGGANTNSNSSGCPSPVSASPSNSGLDSNSANATIFPILSSSGSIEPMCILNKNSIDEGISITENDEKHCRSRSSSTLSAASSLASQQTLSGDIQDDTVLMDDAKSETSSIGGCSTFSIESSSCDSGAKTATTFFSKLVVDEGGNNSSLCASPKSQKSFYINKHGTGTKKFIVNHAGCEQINNATGMVRQDTIADSTVVAVESMAVLPKT